MLHYSSFILLCGILLSSLAAAAGRDQVLLQDVTLIPDSVYTVGEWPLTEDAHASKYFELCIVADSVLGYDDNTLIYIEVKYKMGDAGFYGADILRADTVHCIAYPTATVLIDSVRMPISPDSGYCIQSAIDLHRTRFFELSVTDTIRLTAKLITQP